MTDGNVKGPIAHDHLPVLPGLEALNPFYENPKVYSVLRRVGAYQLPSGWVQDK